MPLAYASLIANLISFAPALAQDSQEVIKVDEIKSNFNEDSEDAESVKSFQRLAPNSASELKSQEFVADNSLTQTNTFSGGTLLEETTFSGVEENAMAQVTGQADKDTSCAS